ncbi:MAG: hypothetical protein IPL71_05365 [Anaerolineales bacterium]|uniref:LiaI-LiaF-like domain-containing protein n=1 Tax=Candidatus Villigracilis proximus TaxID=3140683 RepID=UPI003136CBC8|nr:hypothetical protein [Anaerolineales bacterium]
MKNNQLFWGVILLLVGGLMLANEMGIKLPNGVSFTELFWPLLLILGGVWVLVGTFFRGAIELENASIDLQGATSANLKVSHGAGELKIHSGANANELAHGSFAGGLQQKASRNGDRLEVRMRPAKEVMDFPFFGPRSQLDWDVALNAQIPTALTLNLGANKSVIDLRDMNITDLKLEMGASEIQLTLPASGRFNADLDFGAASLEVTIPEGLSARIRASLGAADLNINQSRFPRNGSYYQSPDFDSAANAVDMTIDAGAASIKIK